MSVILKDISNVTKYTFPGGIDVKGEPWGQRLDSEPQSYAHGDIVTADEKVSSRIVYIHGRFGEASSAAMLTELKSMKKACYTSGYRLYATQNPNEYYNVKCLGFESEFLGQLTRAEVSIDFFVADGFRYYKDVTTDTKNPVVSGTPYALTNDNDGDIEVSPIISYTAGGTQTNVKIANAGDAAKYFEYAGGLVDTDVLEVDCLEGTVEKNGSSDIANWSGSFINLVSGVNTITCEITGTAGTSILSFEFRKRYL